MASHRTMSNTTLKQRPFSNYTLYYILERELFYKVSGIKTEKKVISAEGDLQFCRDIARSFPSRPSRYASLELPSTWFIRKTSCRRDRSKMAGIALFNLSTMIAASWNTCPKEVKSYVNDIAHILEQHYESVVLCKEIEPSFIKPVSIEHVVGNYLRHGSSWDKDGVQRATVGVYNSVWNHQSLPVSKALTPTAHDMPTLHEEQTQTNPSVSSSLQGRKINDEMNYVKGCIDFTESIKRHMRNTAGSQIALDNTFKFEASKPQDRTIKATFYHVQPIPGDMFYQPAMKYRRSREGYADTNEKDGQFVKECTGQRELYVYSKPMSNDKDYSNPEATVNEGSSEVAMSNEEIIEI